MFCFSSQDTDNNPRRNDHDIAGLRVHLSLYIYVYLGQKMLLYIDEVNCNNFYHRNIY